jgi:choline kinase
LQRALEAVGEKDYFERALELCTQDRSIRLMPVDVGRQFCMEVDFAEDLEAVRKYVAANVVTSAPKTGGAGAGAGPVTEATPDAARKPALT